MKIKKIILSIMLAGLLPVAAGASPLSLAHSVGFSGCDRLVQHAFKDLRSYPDWIVMGDAFEAVQRRQITFRLIEGKGSDYITQFLTFTEIGEYCTLHRITMLRFSSTCIDLTSENDNLPRGKVAFGGVRFGSTGRNHFVWQSTKNGGCREFVLEPEIWLNDSAFQKKQAHQKRDNDSGVRWEKKQ